jgi:hypothetical protein
MATKRAKGEGVTIDAATYNDAQAVMRELAFRGAKEEALVMRIAKVCGFTEVMAEIKRLRLYIKKHAKPDRSARAVAANAGRHRKRKGTDESHKDGSSAES